MRPCEVVGDPNGIRHFLCCSSTVKAPLCLVAIPIGLVQSFSAVIEASISKADRSDLNGSWHLTSVELTTKGLSILLKTIMRYRNRHSH